VVAENGNLIQSTVNDNKAWYFPYEDVSVDLSESRNDDSLSENGCPMGL